MYNTYEYKNKVVIFPHENGVGILYPCVESGLTLQQIIDKDIGPGVKYEVMDASHPDLSDQTYRNAWIFVE